MLKKTDVIKYRATDMDERPMSSGFFVSDIHAIGAFKEELEPGLYKIYKGKDNEFIRCIYVGYEVTETCPECDSEVSLDWNVAESGYVVYCPYCGNKMMLCDECRHAADNLSQRCDWCKDGCFRNKLEIKQ